MGAARRERSRKEASFLDLIRSELRELKLDIASIKAILDTGNEMVDLALVPPPAPPPLDVFDRNYLLKVRQLTLAHDANLGMSSQTHVAWSPEGLVYVKEPFFQHGMDLPDNGSSRLIATVKEDILKGRELTAQTQPAFAIDEFRKLPRVAWEPLDLEKIQLFSFGEKPTLDWHMHELSMAVATAVPHDDFDFDFQELVEIPTREPPVLIDDEKFAVFHRLCMGFLCKYSSDGVNVPITAAIGFEFESALRASGILEDCRNGVLLEVNHLAQLFEGQQITMDIVGAFFSTISDSLRARGEETDVDYFRLLGSQIRDERTVVAFSAFLQDAWKEHVSLAQRLVSPDFTLQVYDDLLCQLRIIDPVHHLLPEHATNGVLPNRGLLQREFRKIGESILKLSTQND